MARKMKDSGIEWIGEIPEGWEVAKLKNIVSIVRGGSPRPIEAYMSDNDNDVNWIRISDTEKGSKYITHTSRKLIASGISKSRFIKRGSLILTNSMSFGEPYILDIDGCIHDGWVAFSDFKKIDKEFLYYFLTSPLAKIQFEQQVDGGVVKNLNIDKIGDTVILLPSLIDQNKIIAHLDSLTSETNSLLSKTITSIEEYKKLKQAVITQAVTKGVRGEREIKESKLPWASKIPKAWNICAIRHIMFECKERTKDSHEEQLSVTQQYGIIKSSDASIANPSLSLDDWRIVAIGDIVFNKYKAHSGVFFVSPFSGIVTFNYSVYRCFPNCYAKYFEYQYKTHGCISEFRTRMHGVGNSISPLYTKDLMKIKVVCPPLDEQKEIANYLDAKCAEIDKLIAKKEQLVKELESYKKSLIYEVVTGKREV